MKTLLALLSTFLIFSISLKAQYITGQVKDQNTKQSLVRASITIGKRGIISDQNGLFKLSIKETDWEQNLSIGISHVGYHSFTLPIKSFKNGTTILLAPQNKELQEVIISSSARDLIKKAIDAIPQNYRSIDFTLIGNYLQTVRRTKTDTVFKIDYRANTRMNYQKNSQKSTEVELLSYKKTNFPSMDSARYIHWRKDGKILEHFDFVYNHDDFLDPQKLQKYQYQIIDIKNINGRSTYQIKFELIRNPNQYFGNIYIDEESYAIIAFDFIDSNAKNSDEEDFEKSENTLLYGNTTYKKEGDYWFVDSLTFSKSTKFLGQLGYISIAYKTDEINLEKQSLASNFHTRLTADMIMENLGNEKGIPNLQVIQSSSKNQTNKSLLKQHKLSFHSLYGSSMPLYHINYLTNQPEWNQIMGATKPNQGNPLIPQIQVGVGADYRSFGFTYLSNFTIGATSSYYTAYLYELFYQFEFNQKKRPMVISPIIGKSSFTTYHALNKFTPSQSFQTTHDLENEEFKARQQININGFYLGLNLGIHLTRSKVIGMGFKYQIPNQWKEELYFRRVSNTFFQNLIGSNNKTIVLPFQTVESIPNQFSFNLFYLIH